MGAFYLVFKPDRALRERTLAHLESAYQEQGFTQPHRLELRHMSLGFYGKLAGAAPQLVQDGDGRFAALCGIAMIDATIGTPSSFWRLAVITSRQLSKVRSDGSLILLFSARVDFG
jgi:hypothetical protein